MDQCNLTRKKMRVEQSDMSWILTIHWTVSDMYVLDKLINPSVTLGCKFQLLPRMVGFLIYGTLFKFIHNHTAHQY
jgi:hypothetical protein